MKRLFDQLVDLHGSFSASRELAFVGDHIVRDPISRRQLWESYIPFVGPEYETGGLLLIGTAQSLAKLGRKKEDSEWRKATGMPGSPLYRLYRAGEQTVERPLLEDEVAFGSISIQPYMDGIFAGIAGAALAATRREAPGTLDAVTRRIAVTNFFKHSLQTPEGNDLNPLALPKEIKRKYSEIVLKEYVLRELAVLKPRVVVAFSERIADMIRAVWRGGRVHGIYDPAYLKRGGSLKSFQEQISKTTLESGVRDSILRYIAQMNQPYRTGKARAAEIYLTKYYCDFSGAVDP